MEATGRQADYPLEVRNVSRPDRPFVRYLLAMLQLQPRCGLGSAATPRKE